jgi:hypothetical protein
MTAGMAVLAVAPDPLQPSGAAANTAIPTLKQQIYARAGRDDYEQWITQVTPVGGCTKPVRLRGQLVDLDSRTGEITRQLNTGSELPDGVVYKACGSRRASQCPACAEVYRRDAFFLLQAGLVGGDGGPDTAGRHPCIFATLTAPGFGPVHTRRTRGERVLPCRPRRRRDEVCPHGVLLSCPRIHREDDQVLGKPICVRCFDYTAAVVWNIHAGELWRRTTQTLNRALNRTSVGIRVKASFGKVAEFQTRGLVHFHVLIRLDRHNPEDPDDLLPPAHLTAGHLEQALRQAVADTWFMTMPHPDQSDGWVVEWGTQLDIKTIRSGPGGEITDAKVVAYLAKYATKSTEAIGGVSARITPDSIGVYGDPKSHLGRLIAAAWQIGDLPDRPEYGEFLRLRRWAHMLGYGGHFTTRSRRYSTTFTQRRQRRQAYRRAHPTSRREASEMHDQETTVTLTALRYEGSGWRTSGDAELAATAAAMARHYADIEAEERACSEPTAPNR